MKTKHEIKYKRGSLPPITIPEGTLCSPANNECGPPCYWVHAWPGMSAEEAAWEKKYGLLIPSMEVEE